ncbi:MAG TPA: DUF1385 domain-containing protein [Anaerolineaceae bacterium]|uniref:Putative membrane protein n=1 Tax=Anaerolinea thermophila TaxID=167964 RepID=A0A101FY40_9CHLR|nr:MAG: putative membrane protein [Anaerolinea thermophila]HAF61241.1 DUF1385 domain-containing protein [Anaerolineaceae bacterium]
MTEKRDQPSTMENYGGQALIEGILMRGRRYLTAAFRLPDGSIKVVEEELTGIYKKKIRDIPFLRGLIILWDSLVLGMKYLTISSNFQLEEEGEKIEGPALYLTLAVSMIFALVIFFLIPTLLMQLLYKYTGLSNFLINVVEGIVRLGIIILYLWLIRKMEDIMRVFSYHGAEHKTILAYEHGEDLEIASIQKYSTAHPRCGTSFLLTVAIISIFIFAMVPTPTIGLRILSRLILIPVVSMISYEIIRLLGKYEKNPIVKALSQPNLALQKLTTNEPSDDMVEVAVSALSRLIILEKQE